MHNLTHSIFNNFQDPKENLSLLVTIIIPVHNQLDYTLKCLDSISRYTTEITYEIIILDDQSDLDVFIQLSKLNNVRLIRNFKNIGFIRSCNRAAYNARGKYLLFLNNDTQVTIGWLKSMLYVFDLKKDAGLVGAKLIYPNNTLQEAGGIIWRDASGWNYGKNDDPNKPEYNYLRETDYCSGACILVKTRIFKYLGGFDDLYAPAYYEDADLAFKIRSIGLKVYYQPASTIIHYEGISSGTDLTQGIKKYQSVNSLKFYNKWKNILDLEYKSNGQDLFIARERSVSRKIILIIDHYVPHFDQDAGSRFIYAYIKFFINEGFSVKFIGDNFYNHEPYTTKLQQLGVEVLIGSWYAENWNTWLSNNGKYIHYTFLSRAHIAVKYIESLRQYTRSKILFYGVDLISRTLLKESINNKNVNNSDQASAWQKMEDDIFFKVDAVYYPSELETNEITTRFPRIKAYTLPPIIEESLQTKSSPYSASQREGLLFVGGFRHPPNIKSILWFCKNIFPKIVQRIDSIHLTIVGSHPTPEIISLANENIEITGYISDEMLNKYYNKARLIIVPLLYGGGIKGKILEALSRKIPIITTPDGAEGIYESESTMVITPTETFDEVLIDLYQNTDKLNEISKKTSNIIEKYYSEKSTKLVLSKEMEFS